MERTGDLNVAFQHPGKGSGGWEIEKRPQDKGVSPLPPPPLSGLLSLHLP